jgi:hypothetical protein
VSPFDFLSLKNAVNVHSKSNKQKKIVFVGILKANEENSWIRIHESEAWIPGSTPKCHGSATLVSRPAWLPESNAKLAVFRIHIH